MPLLKEKKEPFHPYSRRIDYSELLFSFQMLFVKDVYVIVQSTFISGQIQELCSQDGRQRIPV